MEGSHDAAETKYAPRLCATACASSLALAVGIHFTTVWVGAILIHRLWFGSGPSDPLLAYISHRLALRAKIDQNRLTVTIWNARSRSNPYNRINRINRICPRYQAREILVRICRERRADGRSAASASWDQSQIQSVGRCRQAPPCEPGSGRGSHGSAVRWKQAHPIGNFDKNGRRTLGSFASLAGKVGCASSTRRTDHSENTVCSGQ